MRNTAIATLAATVLLSAGMLGKRVEAMTFDTPSAFAAADTDLVERAAVVCGYHGCVRVYRPYGYYRYYQPWGWSDIGRPGYYVPYYEYHRPWGWSDVGRRGW
jgi:hypothetical protein